MANAPVEMVKKYYAGEEAREGLLTQITEEKVVPALDDEFARGFGIATVAELRSELETSYRNQETGRIEGDLRERLVRELIARNPFAVPDAMVARQLEFMHDNLVKRLRSQGMNPEVLGLTPQNFAERYREAAVGQVQGTLLLEAIGRQEGIIAEEAEIDARLEEIAKLANAPLEAVRTYYAGEEARAGLMEQIAEEKAVHFLLEQARLTEVPRAALEAAKEA